MGRVFIHDLDRSLSIKTRDERTQNIDSRPSIFILPYIDVDRPSILEIDDF